MNPMVLYKRLNDLAIVPTKGSEYSAGYDLYAAIESDIEIAPHKTVMIGTGLAFEIPPYTFMGIFARSGLATKKGLRPANCVGVVDSDYRGEVKVALHNDSDEVMTVESGERIAQAIVLPFYQIGLEEVDELSDTDR